MERADDPKIIGERLRVIRGIRPRTKVADEIGISRSALAKYEAGLRVPRGPVKTRIAAYYGTTVEQLFYAKQ